MWRVRGPVPHHPPVRVHAVHAESPTTARVCTTGQRTRRRAGFDMAFPIPSHLPRRGVPQDISSQILAKVSSATTKTLTADLATSWIAELDETILQTKVASEHLVYFSASLRLDAAEQDSRAAERRLARVPPPAFHLQVCAASPADAHRQRGHAHGRGVTS